MKLHTEVFIGAKFDNDMSTIFLDNPDQKFIVFQKFSDAYTPTTALISFEQVLD